MRENKMTPGTIDASQRKAARVAGFALVFAMAIVVFSNFYVSAGLIVPGDATETARNILAHTTRFRFSVACDLLYVTNLLVLLSALYVIFEPVGRGMALVAAFFRLAYAIAWIVLTLNMLSALRLLGDASYLHAFEPAQLQALSRLHLADTFDDYYTGLPFFGLASTVCSILWFKSRYIPRALAAFGMASSAWCVLCAFAFIVFPHFNETVNDWLFDTPMGLFEMATGFWLLFKGLRPADFAGAASDRVA
jgi:hypothetical protein